ncbi:hypothetical protein BXY85_1277 [Roseivirga pacifica]|uniref:Uncharacterized protein n=1 Tax=Roseivirga pacifica TaxID=1267423 RepID=A0A1I0MC41_9BACT|nr:hypothetical protein [Roseivirga pacifica]RKQ50263.1 hypothetical protein BXY85_1277 [Roseivirga pacifica]SEV85809.1 hypothetical protein SAMN05216290_0261 [Roseivirga pacifica]
MKTLLVSSQLASNRSCTFTVEEDVLVVQSTGHRTPGMVLQQALNFYDQIHRNCLEKRLHKVLIISEVTGRLTENESEQIVNYISRLEFTEKFKVALVDLNFSSYLDNLFAEQMSIKLDFTGRVFHHEESGRGWIGLPF